MNQNYVSFKSPQPYPEFTGRLKKIQLISNNMGYGPEPEQGEELEQRLTITDKGRVWLSRYCYDRENNKLFLKGKESFKISAEAVNAIMDAVTDYFSGDYKICFATDIGSWDLMLTNDENKKICVTGSLTSNSLYPEEDISNVIRKNLGRNDLFVFDGNPDEITRIEVKYHRLTKIKPKDPPEEIGDNYITLDYHESLVLDRETETMEHISELGSGCKITKTYHIEGGIVSLLDSFDLYVFTDLPDKIPDTVEDPLDSRNYEISIFTKLGESRVITGAFDSNGLPLNWVEFIEYIYDFMQFYEPGELFDPEIYKKPKRRKSDLIFCNVEFEDYGRTYCYLADSDDYSVSDKVVVPAGPDNVESVVTIKSIEYRQPEDAPYPVEKTKHILRKYGKDEPKTKSSGWKDLYIENSTGSENGIVIRDEEYKKTCRITLEKCPTYYAITCGVYGSMFHTAFCSEENRNETYEAIKKDLQDFIDTEMTPEEMQNFYVEFTNKYR